MNLAELGYVFAVKAIDEKAGTIEFFSTSWGQGKDKVKRPLELVDCVELLETRDRQTFSKPWLLLLESIAQ